MVELLFPMQSTRVRFPSGPPIIQELYVGNYNLLIEWFKAISSYHRSRFSRFSTTENKPDGERRTKTNENPIQTIRLRLYARGAGLCPMRNKAKSITRPFGSVRDKRAHYTSQGEAVVAIRVHIPAVESSNLSPATTR